jgi:acyl carrier protein
MTDQEVFNGLKKIIEQNAPRNGRPSSLSMETNLEELGIDSAHRIDILLETEEAFGISIEETAFGQVQRLGGLVALVNEAIAKR